MQEAAKIAEGMPDPGRDIGLKGLVEAYERQIIQSALAANSGNQRRAAAALGLLRRPMDVVR